MLHVLFVLWLDGLSFLSHFKDPEFSVVLSIYTGFIRMYLTPAQLTSPHCSSLIFSCLSYCIGFRPISLSFEGFILRRDSPATYVLLGFAPSPDWCTVSPQGNLPCPFLFSLISLFPLPSAHSSISSLIPPRIFTSLLPLVLWSPY